MVEPGNYNNTYNQCGDELNRRYQLAWTFSVLWCHQETARAAPERHIVPILPALCAAHERSLNQIKWLLKIKYEATPHCPG
jgi:hypothetical protein